jgi:ferredoxin
MKTVCSIYFSPTGNTKRIIEGFLFGQNEINYISFDITLYRKRQELVESIASLDVKPDYWIIGCPVYSGCVPELMIEQIKKLNGKNIPTLVLVTYGNKSYGISLKQLNRELERQNFSIVGMGAFIGEHSYSEKFSIAKNRPDDFDLKVANKYGGKIFNTPQLKPLENSINGKIDFVAKIMPNGGPKPFVKSELCINCQICVENCPKELIDAKTKIFKDTESNEQCLSCMSCVKKCPVKAREYIIPQPVEYLLDKLYFKKSRKVRKEPFMIFRA